MFPNAQQDHIIKRYVRARTRTCSRWARRRCSSTASSCEDLPQVARLLARAALQRRREGDPGGCRRWGYSIAAASVGVKHRLVEEFQVEPGALSTADQLKDFGKRHYIFHYTYQFEYMLDGTPCQPWNIGEYSLDKRHFNDLSPAYPLPPPPEKANAAAFWLHNAWNEAMGAAGDRWPVRQQSGRPTIQTVHGRRRPTGSRATPTDSRRSCERTRW